MESRENQACCKVNIVTVCPSLARQASRNAGSFGLAPGRKAVKDHNCSSSAKPRMSSWVKLNGIVQHITLVLPENARWKAEVVESTPVEVFTHSLDMVLDSTLLMLLQTGGLHLLQSSSAATILLSGQLYWSHFFLLLLKIPS